MLIPIRKSGVFSNGKGRGILITQGLGGCLLVTNKRILFRIFRKPEEIDNVGRILVRITYNWHNRKKTLEFFVWRNSLFIEREWPNGPSIGILLHGKLFPYQFPITCTVEFFAQPRIIGRLLPWKSTTKQQIFGKIILWKYTTRPIIFCSSLRLRILVHFLTGKRLDGSGSDLQVDYRWIWDLHAGFERFASILPIGDRIIYDRNLKDKAGLCVKFGKSYSAWPNPPFTGTEHEINQQTYERDIKETREINSENKMHVDLTLCYRLRDSQWFGQRPPSSLGEDIGGTSIPRTKSGQPLKDRYAGIVGGTILTTNYTGYLLAQELGHCLLLEPKESPHYDLHGPEWHVRPEDSQINDKYAFDFVFRRPAFSPEPSSGGIDSTPDSDTEPKVCLFDAMNGRCSTDNVVYNVFDWNWLVLNRPLGPLPDPISVSDWKNRFSWLRKLNTKPSKPDTLFDFKGLIEEVERKKISPLLITKGRKKIISDIKGLDFDKIYGSTEDDDSEFVAKPIVNP